MLATGVGEAKQGGGEAAGTASRLADEASS
jgi:hypothetical protein